MSITTRGWGNKNITTSGWGIGWKGIIRKGLKYFNLYIKRIKEFIVER